MQPKIKVKKPIYFSLWIGEEWVCLTPNFLDKMNKDDIHTIEYGNGGSSTVSKHNKRVINHASKKGIKIIKAEFGKNSLPLLPFFRIDSDDDNEQKKLSTICVPQTIDTIDPGIYKTEKSLIPLAIFLETGEEMDFSKVEFALPLLNQDFLKVLANSREITSYKKKKEIYKSEQKGFYKGTTTKYYKLKEGINLNENEVHYLAKELGGYNDTIDIGYGYDNNRVWGEVSAAETKNGKVTIIEVNFGNHSICGIMDKEIRKIARPMNERESFHAYINKRTQFDRNIEKEREKRAKKKNIDYFRTKMLGDLAKSYILDEKYIEWGIDKNLFEEKAWDYYFKNKEKCSDISSLFDDGISIEEFYMMHLIREKFKDNRKIAEEHQCKIKEKQASFISILKGISQKEFER